MTVTVTFATFVEGQPLAPVTVSAYTVVDGGFAVGVQLNGSDSPVTGSHEQDTPPEPSRSAVSPVQSAPPPPATAVGRVLTVSTAVVEVRDWPKPSVTRTS